MPKNGTQPNVSFIEAPNLPDAQLPREVASIHWIAEFGREGVSLLLQATSGR